MKNFFHKVLMILRSRVFWIWIVVTGLFTGTWFSLYQIQVLNEEHYTELAQANRYEERIKEGERGNIYDRYGRPLAINEISETLYFSPDTEVENLSLVVENLLTLLDQNGETLSLETVFPLEYRNGVFLYREGYQDYDDLGRLNFLAEVYNTSRALLTEEQIQTTASQAAAIIRTDMFGISDNLSNEDFIRVASVRYAIFSGRFSPATPVRIARNVSQKTIISLMERRSSFPGFTVEEEYTRVYPEGALFAHIVGYTGRINREELAAMTSLGYAYSEDATIGKTGLEESMETVLRGAEGISRVEYSRDTGERISEVTLAPSSQGDCLFLTIDRDIQEMAYDALYQQIKTLLLEKITGISQETDGITPETYSLSDIFTALIANHFLPSSVIDSSQGEYAALFRQTYTSEATRCLDELLDTILESREYPLKDYPDTLKDLYDLLITQMRDEGRLTYDYQEDEDFYPGYAAGEVSPYTFFTYCLEHHYLKTESYNIEKGATTEEILEAIYTKERIVLWQDEEFKSTLYRHMIDTGIYSETLFLDLLYDEGLLSNEDGSLEALHNGELTPLDCVLQKIRQDELTPANINLDPCGGSMVVSDPNTGEVLAMVSYPSYDPNRFINDADYYASVILDASGPLTFRALGEMRAIGSTYKMCTSIAGLDTGTITKDTAIYDGYQYPYVNSPDKPVCWSTVSHGYLTVTTALEHSCNYFFYEVGYLLSEPDGEHHFDDDVGLNKLASYAKRLGLAELTGIEISEGIPKASDMDAVRSAIGQGTNAFSCANLNRYTNTIANGGTVYDLFIIDEVHSSEGEILRKTMAGNSRETGISDSTYVLVHEGMRLVVTGELPQYFTELEANGIHCAGKTGTAQEIYGRPDHSVFTGYTQAEDPTISVSIFIPFGGGSSKAIPVFTQFVADYYGLHLDR